MKEHFPNAHRIVPIEEGDPVADPRRFRRCLGQFATGIAIITTTSGSERTGVTVNSFSSVSLEPPLVQWSIAHTSRSYQSFMAAESFAINILGSGQVDVANHFASNAEDKFTSGDWFGGTSGAPLLKDAIAHLECLREAEHEGGDHAILVGRVLRFATFEGGPLLFVQGKYGVAANHPDANPASGLTADGGANQSNDELISLIVQAYRSVSSRFERHRTAEGLNHAQARVLRAVYRNPASTFDHILRITFLGRRDAEDAVVALVDRGWLERGSADKLHLTELGSLRREAIDDRWAAFRANQLSGIPEGQVSAAAQVLKQIIDGSSSLH